MIIPLLLLSISFAAAQTKPGIIEGLVRADGGGVPLADVEVRVREIKTKTDAAGRYTLREVPPGRHQLNVGGRRNIVMGSKTVVVAGGQTVAIDFTLPIKGTISGRVVNEHDELEAGIEVALIGREYVAGSEHHFFQNLAYTNDEGEYRMQFVQPGIPYVVLFRKREARKLPAVSDAPSEPKLRRRRSFRSTILARRIRKAAPSSCCAAVSNANRLMRAFHALPLSARKAF